MKNKTIILGLLLLASSRVFAQDSKFKLGIRFAPNVSFNKVEDTDEKDTLEFSTNSAGIRFSAGIFGDFYFSNNYAFHTGLWYTVNRIGLQYSSSKPEYGNGKTIFNTQVLQVPVALKLFTNEIGTDMKLYFTLGGTLGFRINEKNLEWETSGVANPEVVSKPSKGNATSLFDFGLLLGIGTEYQLAESTILYGGLSYNRGLLDIPSKDGLFKMRKNADQYYVLNNQYIGIEIGLKF